MDIKILGTGCKDCERLFEMTNKVIKDLGVDAKVVKIEEPLVILSLGVMKVPGIMIDRDVVHTGSVPTEEELVELIRNAKA